VTDENRNYWRQFLIEEGKKWAARSFFLFFGAGVLLLLTPIGHNAKSIWESPEKLASIAEQLDELTTAIDALAGNNRITVQPDGMSYVREPVIFGDDLELVLYIGRTKLGTVCNLKELIPQFTDENGVTAAANPIKARVQLGVEIVRRKVPLTPPIGLVAGRTRIQLQLEYVCGGRTVFENTKPVFYYAQTPLVE